MKNTGNSGVARWYLLYIISSKIFTDNNIPYLLAAQKDHFSFEIFVRKPLENKAF